MLCFISHQFSIKCHKQKLVWIRWPTILLISHSLLFWRRYFNLVLAQCCNYSSFLMIFGNTFWHIVINSIIAQKSVSRHERGDLWNPGVIIPRCCQFLYFLISFIIRLDLHECWLKRQNLSFSPSMEIIINVTRK